LAQAILAQATAAATHPAASHPRPAVARRSILRLRLVWTSLTLRACRVELHSMPEATKFVKCFACSRACGKEGSTDVFRCGQGHEFSVCGQVCVAKFHAACEDVPSKIREGWERHEARRLNSRGGKEKRDMTCSKQGMASLPRSAKDQVKLMEEAEASGRRMCPQPSDEDRLLAPLCSCLISHAESSARRGGAVEDEDEEPSTATPSEEESPRAAEMPPELLDDDSLVLLQKDDEDEVAAPHPGKRKNPKARKEKVLIPLDGHLVANLSSLESQRTRSAASPARGLARSPSTTFKRDMVSPSPLLSSRPRSVPPSQSAKPSPPPRSPLGGRPAPASWPPEAKAPPELLKVSSSPAHKATSPAKAPSPKAADPPKAKASAKAVASSPKAEAPKGKAPSPKAEAPKVPVAKAGVMSGQVVPLAVSSGVFAVAVAGAGAGEGPPGSLASTQPAAPVSPVAAVASVPPVPAVPPPPPLPRGWKAVWCLAEEDYYFWQKSTGTVTWDLSLAAWLPAPSSQSAAEGPALALGECVCFSHYRQPGDDTGYLRLLRGDRVQVTWTDGVPGGWVHCTSLADSGHGYVPQGILVDSPPPVRRAISLGEGLVTLAEFSAPADQDGYLSVRPGDELVADHGTVDPSIWVYASRSRSAEGGQPVEKGWVPVCVLAP